MSLHDVLLQLRKDYLASLPAKAQHILELYKTGEFSLVETEFHKLKGTGQTYGFSEISQLGQMAEELCQGDVHIREQMLTIALDLLNRIYQTRQQGHAFDLESQPGFRQLLLLVEQYHASPQFKVG